MANSRDTILNLFPDNNNNEITASKIRQFVTAIFDEELDINEIQDRLNSTNIDKPLSANQGRILKNEIDALDTKVDIKEDLLPSGNVDDILSLDPNGNKVWIAQTTFNETVVYDDLDSLSTTDALSANMGRALNDLITNERLVNISQDSLIQLNTDAIIVDELRITQNEADIAQNTLDITANSDQINTNISRINTNVTDIVNLNTSVSALDGRVTQNEADIVSVNSRVTITDVNVSQNAQDIANLTPRVSVNEGDISTLQGLVGGVNVPSLEGIVTSNTSAIAVLDARVTGQDGLINTNTTSIGTNTASIAINRSSISTLDVRVTTNEADIIVNATNIGLNVIGISDLDVRVTQNELDIAQNSSLINDNIISISDNVNAINLNKIDIDNNTADINTLRTDVDANQILIETNRTDILAGDALTENNRVDIVRLGQDLENTDTQVAENTVLINTKENFLGLPVTQYQVLASDTDGNRLWVDNAFSASKLQVIDNLNANGDTTNALSANMGYVLNQDVQSREPYLNNPYKDNMILTSLIDGTRTWREANILNVDYGEFFGFGNPIDSVDIVPALVTYFTSQAPTQFEAFANRINPPAQSDITQTATWASSDPSIAMVNNQGIVFMVGGTGSVNITASIDDGHGLGNLITGTSVITVNAVLIITIDVTPINPSAVQGEQVQFTAIATFNDGSVENITSTSSWTSNNTAVAIVSNSSGDIGNATANLGGITGTAEISATKDDGSNSNDIVGTSDMFVSN